MGGRRGVERRGTPTKPKPSMVPRVAQKATKQPAQTFRSWWTDPDFSKALKDRQAESWGPLGHVSATSLAVGSNEITRARPPKSTEFAPSKK